MELREACPGDAPVIDRLYSLLVPGDDAICLRPDRIVEIGADPCNFLFVVEDGRRAVGATAFLTLCLDPMYGDRPFAVLENIIVDPSRRRAGVGRFLLQGIESFCWIRGCTKIMLLSAASRTDAHRFFEGSGFSGHKKVAFVKYRGENALK